MTFPPNALSGDCYIAACGILSADNSGFYSVSDAHDVQASAFRVLLFARAMMEVSKQVGNHLI